MTRDQSKLCSRFGAYALALAIYALNLPSINYFPLEYAWRPGYVPGLPSVDWYGRVLWSLLVVLLSMPVFRFLIFRARKEALADEWSGRVNRVAVLSFLVMVISTLWTVVQAFTATAP